MRTSRFLSSLAVAGAMWLALPAEVASAGDAGPEDASCRAADGSSLCDAGADAGQSEDDAATAVNPHCTATGNPCTSTAECCEGYYCGDFSATSTSFVCGSLTPNTIPTSSCSAGRSSTANGLELVALVGCAIGIGARRRRRRGAEQLVRTCTRVPIAKTEAARRRDRR